MGWGRNGRSKRRIHIVVREQAGSLHLGLIGSIVSTSNLRMGMVTDRFLIESIPGN